MRFHLTAPAGLAMTAICAAQAGELPPELQARFVKLLCGSMGSSISTIASNDAALNGILSKMGIGIDGKSKLAWASSEGEVAPYKATGKLVITPKLEWLNKGGAIAVVEEGGKPQIYLHMGNIGETGVVLSDSLLKIGKRI